jgi:hypothetical protein
MNPGYPHPTVRTTEPFSTHTQLMFEKLLAEQSVVSTKHQNPEVSQVNLATSGLPANMKVNE